MAVKIEISLAEKSDLPDILTLQKDCYQSEGEIYNNFEIQPLIQDLASLDIEFRNSAILKGLVDGEIVASIRGYSKNDSCFIGKLIVKKEFQNLGLGSKMMASIESIFKDCKRYELFTGNRSEKNLYLYSKLGYKEFKREQVDNSLILIYLEKLK